MNGFKIYNSINKKFFEDEEVFVNGNGDMFFIYSKGIQELCKDENVLCIDSELTDINNKEIYHDSSIFEFGYSVGEAVHIGYSYYDEDDFCYKIKILSSILRNGATNKFKGQSFLFDSDMIDFKIIDTIQENKLGLIK